MSSQNNDNQQPNPGANREDANREEVCPIRQRRDDREDRERRERLVPHELRERRVRPVLFLDEEAEAIGALDQKGLTSLFRLIRQVNPTMLQEPTRDEIGRLIMHERDATVIWEQDRALEEARRVEAERQAARRVQAERLAAFLVERDRLDAEWVRAHTEVLRPNDEGMRLSDETRRLNAEAERAIDEYVRLPAESNRPHSEAGKPTCRSGRCT